MLGNSGSWGKSLRNTLKRTMKNFHLLQLFKAVEPSDATNLSDPYNMINQVYQIIKWSIKTILLFICVRLRVDWKRQIHKESSVLRTIPSMGKMLIQDFTMLIFGQRISSIKT